MELKSKLISGRELVQLDPTTYNIVEAFLGNEPFWCLVALPFDPVIYETQKEGVEPFTEKMFLVAELKKRRKPSIYEITAVVI